MPGCGSGVWVVCCGVGDLEARDDESEAGAGAGECWEANSTSSTDGDLNDDREGLGRAEDVHSELGRGFKRVKSKLVSLDWDCIACRCFGRR